MLALVGLAGVIPVSYSELVSDSACPHLGPIPACHIVSVAYAAIFLCTIHSRIWTAQFFLAGWLPVFLLAFAGTALEWMGHGTCPKTSSEIPKCYFSLGLASAIILPFLIHLWILRQDKKRPT